MSSQLRHISTIGKKNLLNSNTSFTCPHKMAKFVPLMAEISWEVWGTPANFNGFRILAALLHGTLVVGVSQTLRRWTEGASYIRQGGHHVGHWPTFLVITQLRSWYSFYHSTEGGRLSQPRHCREVMQAVYCSGCHDKYNCPHAIQTWSYHSTVRHATTRPLLPALNCFVSVFTSMDATAGYHECCGYQD